MMPPSWKTSLLQAFLVAFLFLSVVNWPQRNDPPYWDGVIGAYQQAAWLSRHEMSYSALRTQLSLAESGPRVAMTSGLAFFYGQALSFASPQSLILGLHVLTWALAAASLALGDSLLRESSDPWTSAGWMACAALDPIFSAQTGAIYQEIPLAFCGMLLIALAHRGFYASAAMVCVLGVFIKPTATVFALALLVWLIVGKLTERYAGIPSIFAKRSFFLILPILILGASFPFLVDSSPPGKSLFQNVLAWLAMLKQEFPYQAIVLILTMIACAVILRRRSLRLRFTEQGRRFGLISLLATTAWGFWLAHSLHHFPLCRYLAVITIPTIVLLGLCCQELLSKKWRAALILTLLTIYGLNQYGALLPALPADFGRSGRMLERSRESLQDIADQRELCRAIEENWPNEPILAKFPSVHMLALPELGYVRQEHPVLPIAVPAGGFLELSLSEEDLEKQAHWNRALVIYSPHCYETIRPSLAPIPKDEILWERRLKGAPLILYRRNRP
jgi:hypothetical protein